MRKFEPNSGCSKIRPVRAAFQSLVMKRLVTRGRINVFVTASDGSDLGSFSCASGSNLRMEFLRRSLPLSEIYDYETKRFDGTAVRACACTRSPWISPCDVAPCVARESSRSHWELGHQLRRRRLLWDLPGGHHRGHGFGVAQRPRGGQSAGEAGPPVALALELPRAPRDGQPHGRRAGSASAPAHLHRRAKQVGPWLIRLIHLMAELSIRWQTFRLALN